MRNSLIVLVFVFFSTLQLQLYSQVTQEWVKTCNVSGNSVEQGIAVTVDSDNNIYSLGYTESSGVNNSRDFLLVKYSPGGTQLWADTYNGPSDNIDDPIAIATSISGNVYITGNSIGTGTGYDIVTMMYDSGGSRQWVQRFNGSGNSLDEVCAIVTDGNNNVYIAGSSFPTIGQSQCFIIKYNSAGQQQWIRIYNQLPAFASSLTLSKNGNFYLTGACHRSTEGNDFMTIKYDNEGVQKWIRCYGSVYCNEVSKLVQVDSQENIYVAGEYDTTIGHKIVTIKYNSNGILLWLRDYMVNYVSPGLFSMAVGKDQNPLLLLWNGTGNNHFEISVIKYDSLGNINWQTSYPGVPQGMAVDNSGSVYVTGWDLIPNVPGGATTIKYNPEGIQQWVKTVNPGQNTTGKSVVIDMYENVYVTGQGVLNNTSNDLMTVKYSQPIGIQPISSETPNQFSLSQNYPNPFNPTTKIKFSIPTLLNPPERGKFGREVSLIVYDMLGKEVATLVNEQLKPGTYEVDFDGSNYASGIYFYKLVAGEFAETKRMVLIK